MNPCPTCGCRLKHHQKAITTGTKKTNLYLVACQLSDKSRWLFKVGISDNVGKRLAQLHHQCDGYLLEHGQLLAAVPTTKRSETVAHEFLAGHRVLGEWYRDEPGTREKLVEIFKLNPFPALIEPTTRVSRRSVVNTGSLGRSRSIKATKRQVQMLRADRYTWEEVASKLGISRATAIRLSSEECVPLGRPKVLNVTRSMIEALRNDPARYSWPQIAQKLGASRSSVLAIWNVVTIPLAVEPGVRID